MDIFRIRAIVVALLLPLEYFFIQKYAVTCLSISLLNLSETNKNMLADRRQTTIDIKSFAPFKDPYFGTILSINNSHIYLRFIDFDIY